jgi:hypothetical protein
MLLKGRYESDELLALRYLNIRMELSEKERFHYLNLEKGFQGELIFDDMLEKDLQEERYIINDLLLEINNSYFQIDNLIISQGVIHLLDVKYFHGDYYIKSDKLYAVATEREYKNPVDQLKRCATLFRQLLQNLKQNYLVESYVIFINPEFTLYQAPLDQPIIFPTQVSRFLKDLNQTSSKLNDGHMKLAKKLLSLHQPKNPYSKLPQYTYEQLRKGVYCYKCNSFLVSKHNYDLICTTCGGREKIELAILRSVKEFNLLFPDRKITTQIISDWCRIDLNRKTICRVLKKHFKVFGNTSNTYFE